MLFIPRAIGGTLRVRAPRRPDAAPTVTVYNNGGGEEVAAATAATLSVVNTTFNAGATGSLDGTTTTSLTLTATTNVAVGDEYLIENAAKQREFVKVRGITSGTVVELYHPILYTYASADPFQGTYISYALTAAVADVAAEDWHAHFAWLLSTVAQPPLVVRFDIVRFAPSSAGPSFTINDVRLYDTESTRRLSTRFDLEGAMLRAQNDVIRDINATRKAGGLVTDDDWRDLGALKFLASYMGPLLGEKYEKTQAMWMKRYQDRLDTMRSQMKSDENQNLAIEPHEGGALGGDSYRA